MGNKAEFFAAVIELVAALVIFDEAWTSWRHVRTLDAPLRGLALNALATIINAAWSFVLVTAGRRLRSPALQADGRHLLADVVTSVGIAAGLLLAVFTGT
jgi:divalent metal cation (Fe/Co/Zn/Cd) transporter